MIERGIKIPEGLLENAESRSLKQISQNEKNLLEEAKEMSLENLGQDGFPEGVDYQLKDYFLQNESLAASLLKELLNIFPKLRISKSPGHDLSHVTDNLASAVRIFAGEKRDLHELFEVFLGIIFHDVNRTLQEMSKDKKLEFLTVDEAALFPVLGIFEALFKNVSELKDFPRIIVKRLLYNVSSGFEAITGHWASDIIHQCDREQLIGPPTIARGLAFDVVQDGRQIPIMERNFLWSWLPLPESPKDRWWLIQYEFFMRNLYPPMSEDGQKIWQELKIDNAVILFLATQGREKVLTRCQVFAPELGMVRRAELHWSKKILPDNIFPNARDRFLNLTREPYNPEIDLVEMAVRMLNVEQVTFPPNFKEELSRHLNFCDDRERKNFFDILFYSMNRRREERNKFIKLVQTLLESKGANSILEVVANFVATEYRKKNSLEDA